MLKEIFSYGKEGLKTLLAKEGLLKILHGKGSKPHGMTDADWEDIDVEAASTIGLCLVDEVIYNVMDEISAAGLLVKLEIVCIMKSLSNKLTHILDHMNIFNKIVSDLLCLEVKSKEEDKTLSLLASLPPLYYLVTTILHERETLEIEEVKATF